MGKSAIYVGNDTTHLSTNLKECTADFYDTGFIDFTEPCEGDVVALRRSGFALDGSTYTYNAAELRLYQVPNLLLKLEEMVSITAPDPGPSDALFPASNLI